MGDEPTSPEGKWREGLALALTLLLASACSQCGFQPDPGVKIVVPAMPTTLDWSTSDPNSWANYPVMLATLRGLTSLGADNSVQPGLAQRWERELRPDGREVYTFHLRPDVKWSDGVTPLRAEDFVFGWRRAVCGRERGEMLDVLGAEEVLRLMGSGVPNAEVQRAVERLGVEAIDPLTLSVTLASARNYFLSRIANVYLFFPAPSRDLAGRSEEEIREYFDRPRGNRPLSLGPYRVESWDRAAERVRLVQNPSSAFAPALGSGESRASVVTLIKSEVGSALYDRGRVDFIFVDNAAALKEEFSAGLQRQELLSTYFLAVNTQRPPLDRVEVRRAIALSLDRDALLEGLLPHARAACALLPPGLLGQDGSAKRSCGARRPGSVGYQQQLGASGSAGDPRLGPSAPNGDQKQLGLPRSAGDPRLGAPGSVRDSRLGPSAPTGAPPLGPSGSAGEVSRPLRMVYRAGESFIPEVAIAERIKSQLALIGISIELEARYDFSV